MDNKVKEKQTAPVQQRSDFKGRVVASQPDDDEIDLLELARELLKHWVLIASVTLAFGILTYCGSRFLITPQYESTATMYILTKETTLTSLADLQIGSQLTSDYKVIVTTRTVLDNTINKLGLSEKLTSEKLNKKITIDNPQNTRILTITAKDPDPVLAKDIANTLAENASEFIADTMEITPPKIIETGIVAAKKSSPSNTKNAAIGALIGFVLVGGIITVKYLLNDAVTTEEDVKKYLELSVLASLPDRTSGSGSKNDDKKTKERKRSRLKQSRRK